VKPSLKNILFSMQFMLNLRVNNQKR